MYSHKILFKIRNPLHRPNGFFDSLLKVHVFKSEHVGLGGLEPHWMVEVSLGRGAGYPWGRAVYVARDCFARLMWGEEHKDRYHYQYGKNGQGDRLPWQVGYTGNANLVPYVDYSETRPVPSPIHPTPDDFDYQPGDQLL
jgi:hypothetical protein